MVTTPSHFKDPVNALGQVNRLLDHETGEVPLKVGKGLLTEVTDLLGEVDLGEFRAELRARWQGLEASLTRKGSEEEKSFTVLEFLKDVRTAADAAQDPIHQS